MADVILNRRNAFSQSEKKTCPNIITCTWRLKLERYVCRQKKVNDCLWHIRSERAVMEPIGSSPSSQEKSVLLCLDPHNHGLLAPRAMRPGFLWYSMSSVTYSSFSACRCLLVTTPWPFLIRISLRGPHFPWPPMPPIHRGQKTSWSWTMSALISRAGNNYFSNHMCPDYNGKAKQEASVSFLSLLNVHSIHLWFF